MLHYKPLTRTDHPSSKNHQIKYEKHFQLPSSVKFCHSFLVANFFFSINLVYGDYHSNAYPSSILITEILLIIWDFISVKTFSYFFTELTTKIHESYYKPYSTHKYNESNWLFRIQNSNLNRQIGVGKEEEFNILPNWLLMHTILVDTTS